MSSHPTADEFSRFDNFTVINTTYKVVAGHAIGADFLIPKQLLVAGDKSSKPRPIIVRYHGGYLIGAGSMFPPFFGPWILQLAERHSAVIVSVNYRLYPESPVTDILTDVRDFWTWLHSAEPSKILDEQTQGRVQLDTDRIITTGESAGGYLSLMTALDHPGEIRAVTAAYPVVDTRVAWYTEANKLPRLGRSYVPRDIFDDHVVKVACGELPAIISNDAKFERNDIIFSAVHNGIIGQMFDVEGRQQLPSQRVEDGAVFPRGGVFILHGRDDTMVPVAEVEALKATANRLDPTLDFHLSIQPGEHGFDEDISIDDPWMKEGLEGVVKSWLA
ncbi:hypothetical protein CMQ_6399 [Grosmannia clavigera kw1407]|uniref:Alpha/beta hydrolase fold-3 domain-containing protein n=1 Tax=Grosmannia clavigera (strain kw1407 / UAMH 11150) TaxID=655863 RepID=F0XL89_GROCL|nr:uncharacterized protein CMQ_6399 [Grosmannia clavigera kw1407]EFX01457.1 hypothetical protein CMQ_6399 [Grosmannia clavigera kw1407]